MRTETVITPPIRGAARTLDISYPSPQIQAIGNLSQGIQWLNRQGVTTWDVGTVTGFGAPPAGSGWDVYRGRMAHKQTGNGVSGGFYQTASGLAINFPTALTSIGGAYNDDYRCWRIVGFLAFDGSGLGAGDIGLEVLPSGGNYDFITALTLGYRLAPTAAGAISVQVRQTGGGALTVNQVVANVDVNDWHAYEMRFIGATATTDGVFKVLIDNVPLAQFSYGAGTLLPGFANGAAVGYTIGNGNRGAAAVYIANGGLQVSASATEQGLL
jgi:hypothetical protein